MADEKVKVDIEAVDNFSSNIDKLKKSVEALGDIKLGQKAIDNYTKQLGNVENMLKNIGNSKNFVSELKKVNEEVEKLTKNYLTMVSTIKKSEINGKVSMRVDNKNNKVNSFNDINKSNTGFSNMKGGWGESSKPRQKVELVDAKVNFDFSAIEKSIKDLKNKLKVDVGAEVDKKSVDSAKKSINDEFKNNKVVANVEVKTKVKEDLSKIQEIANSKPIIQNVKLVTQEESKNKDSNQTKKNTTKKDKSENISSNIKNKVESNGIEIKPTIDEKIVKSLGKELSESIKKEVNNVDLDSLKIKLKSSIDEKFLNKSLLEVISKINEKPFKLKIGKDERYFEKVISDNIKKANSKNIQFKVDSKDLKSSIKDAINFINNSPYTVKLLANINTQNLLRELKNVQAKIPVDINLNNLDMQKIVQNLSSKDVSVPLHISTKGLSQELKDAFKDIVNSGVDIPVKVNQDKFKNSIGSAKDKLNDFISIVYKIAIVINNDKLQTSIDKAKGKIEKLENREIKINTNIKDFLNKIDDISRILKTLQTTKFTIHGEAKVEDAELKLSRLATYINQFNTKALKLSVDLKDARSGIMAIYRMATELTKNKYKLDLNLSSVMGKGSQIQKLATDLKELADALKHIRSRTIKIDFGAGEGRNSASTFIRTIRNLNKALNDIRNNVVINIKVNDRDNSIDRLREISNLLRDINRNRNVNIVTRVRGNRNHRPSYRDSDNDLGDRANFLGSFMTGVTQFFGRSSKGFGSFGEAVARVTQNLINLGGTWGKVGVVLSVFVASIATITSMTSLAAQSVQLFGNMLVEIGTQIYNALKPGIELYKQQQSAIFSFTAALQSVGVLPDGTKLSSMGSQGREIARGISTKLIEQATFDAEMSAFSLEEILRALQGVMPMLMQLGMSAQQAYEVTKGVAGVAKFTQLAPNQVLQEARDLAQGSITSRSSQVANALGITKADLDQFKGDSEALFEFLMGKFKEYSELLNEFEDTAIGRWQQLQERWANVTKSIVEGIAPQFKGLFEFIIEATGRWEDKNKNYFNAITGDWHNAEGDIIATSEDIKKAIESFGNAKDAYASFGIDFDSKNFVSDETFVKIKDALVEIVDYVAQTLDYLSQWAQETFGFSDSVDTAKSIIETIVDFFATSVIILGDILQALFDNKEAIFDIMELTKNVLAILLTIPLSIKVIFDVVVTVLDALGGWVIRLTNIKSLVNSIVSAFGKLASGDLEGAINTLNSGMENYVTNWMVGVKKNFDTLSKDWENLGKLSYEIATGEGFEQFKKLFNVDTKTKGWFTNAVNRNKGEKVKKGDAKDYNASDVKGTPKVDTRELEKANKKAIKDSQKELKEHIRGLREALQDHVDELKELQKQRDIAYEEGFTSIKDYFTQKAELEAEEARLRLEEAQEELTALKSAQFENEYDRLKELHSVQREIKKYSRAVELSTKQQQEVARNMSRWTNETSRFISMYSNTINRGSILQKQTGSGFKYKMTKDVPVSLEGLQDVAVDVTRMVKQIHGVDLDVGHLYGLFLAEVGRSGVSRNWKENRNPGGFTAWSGTPDKFVDWEGGRGPGESGHYERYIDSSYEDFIKYLATNWFQPNRYRTKALTKGVSATDMYDILFSNGYHTSNAPWRRDLYAEGESYSDLYARASQPIQAISNTKQATSIGQKIVDNIGNLIAYSAYDYVKRGVPYVWGGTGQNGVDCSGLVYSIYRSLGIDIERAADEQAEQMKNQGGFFEDAAKLMVGDLVFMRGSYPGSNGVGHVGIYAGDGKYVHAPGSGRNVQYANLSDRRDIVGYGSVRVLTGQFKDLGEQTGALTSNISNLASSVQKVSSLIAGAISVLVDASGEIIGYTPEEQYSRGGIDTRYSTFQEGMSGGVDAQIAGLKDEVKQSINLIAKEFFEQTGQKIEWSSFTGGTHKGGSFGHSAGWKADANINSDFYDLLTKIVTKHGVAAGAEWIGTDNQHVDFSWAEGGIGGPNEGGKYLTKYTTGEQFYNRSREAVKKLETEVQDLDTAVINLVEDRALSYEELINNINSLYASAGGYELDIPNLTGLGHQSYEAAKKANSELVNLMEENSSRILGNYQGTIMKVLVELNNDLSKHRSNSEEDKAYRIARVEDFKNKILDIRRNAFESVFDFNLNEIERNSKFRATDLYTGRYTFKSLMDKYSSYFTDENNKNGLAFAIKQMEDLMAEYTNKGFLKEATDLRNSIESAKNSLFEMFDSWIEQGQKYWDNAEALFNASERFTPTQREFAEREFKAYRAQREYDDRTQLGIKLRNDYSRNLKSINQLVEANKNLATSSEKYADNLVKINNLIDDNKRIETYALENEQLKKLAETSSKMPDLLDDIKKAARDALDEGLVEFLTDGILEAESLEDALKDLAVTILKEIQKVSAKWIVKDLMNKLFGTFNVQEEVPTDPFLQVINQTLITGFNSVVGAISQVGSFGGVGNNTVMPEGMFTVPSVQSKWLNESGNLSLGAFSQPWEKSILNKNAKQDYSFNSFDYDLKNVIDDKFSSLTDSVDTGFLSSVQAVTQFEQNNSNMLVNSQRVQEAHKLLEQTNDSVRSQNEEYMKNKLTSIDSNVQQQTANASSGSGGGFGTGGGFGGGSGIGSLFGESGIGGGYTGAGVTGSWGIGSKLGGMASNILKPVTNLVGQVAGEVADFLNSEVFGSLLNSANGILGSAGAQLAGVGFAISSFIKGDKKEKLLSMIYIELQLIYQQIVSLYSLILAFMQTNSMENQMSMISPLESTQGTTGVGYSVGGSGTGFGLGAFSNPWETSILNPNYRPWETSYGWSMAGLGLNNYGFGSQFGMGGMLSPYSSMFGFGGMGQGQNSIIDYDRIRQDREETLTSSLNPISSVLDLISSGTEATSYATDLMSYNVEDLTMEQFQHNAVSEMDTSDLVYSNDSIDANTTSMAGVQGVLMKTFGAFAKMRNRSRGRSRGNVEAATGGLIRGSGTSTSDSIPAMLSNGEYVINAKNVKKYKPILDLINKGMYTVEGYASGGEVGDSNYSITSEDETEDVSILSLLQSSNSLLASILEAVNSLAGIKTEDENTESQDGTSESEEKEPYTPYSVAHKSSKGIGNKVQSFVNWTGLGNTPEDNRLVEQLGEDVDEPTKMIVDLLQTIADNTYTLVNLLTIIATMDFMKFIYNIITSGIRGIGMKHGGVVKLAKGGTVYNNNGLINGPGSETSDSIPAMLSNGEAVLNAKAVKRLGVNFISAVNNGNFTKIKAHIPHFSDGGIIGDAYQSTARGMTDFANNIGTNVSTTNHMNVALVRDEREAMEHFMKSPRGQRILVDFQKGNGRVFSRFGMA